MNSELYIYDDAIMCFAVKKNTEKKDYRCMSQELLKGILTVLPRTFAHFEG